MAEVALSLPDGREFLVTVPDGQQTVAVTILDCACGCNKWFEPKTPSQKFFNEDHERAFNSAKRPRKTQRPHKKR